MVTSRQTHHGLAGGHERIISLVRQEVGEMHIVWRVIEHLLIGPASPACNVNFDAAQAGCCFQNFVKWLVLREGVDHHHMKSTIERIGFCPLESSRNIMQDKSPTSPAADQLLKIVIGHDGNHGTARQKTMQPVWASPHRQLQRSTVCVNYIPTVSENAINVYKQNCKAERALHEYNLRSLAKQQTQCMY